jgi:CheY-like chemotaxis protein
VTLKSHTKKLVMVVDDSPEVLQSLAITLQMEGYEVVTAENGKDALQALSTMTSMPFALISDWEMPNMNGLQLLDHVATAGLKIERIVIISGTSRKEELIRNMEAIRPALPWIFLEKPFNPDILLETLASSLWGSLKAE